MPNSSAYQATIRDLAARGFLGVSDGADGPRVRLLVQVTVSPRTGDLHRVVPGPGAARPDAGQPPAGPPGAGR